MNEVALCFQFLDSILANDATLTGYAPGGLRRAIAPPYTTSPFTAMLLQSPGADTLTITATRVLVRALFQIVAVGFDSQSVQITNAASQIDALLGGMDGLRNIAVPGGYIAACYRENAISSSEDMDSLIFFTLGGLYRIECYQTS